MNFITSLPGRAINCLVLITYLTSVLNIGRVDAAESSITTTVTAPSATRILRLRGDIYNTPVAPEVFPKHDSYDYKISIKRKAMPLDQGGSAEPGYMIKLKTPKTNVASQNGVMYQFFMADNVPFSDAFMQSIGLEPCLDDRLGMIGLNWRLSNLPNLNFLILRDGTLFVNGNEASQKTVRFSSSGAVHLQNLTLASASLKARKVNMGDGVAIQESSIDLIDPESMVEVDKDATVNLPDLKLLRGRFRNNGNFTGTSQYLDLAAGTVFENNSLYQATIATTFSGAGSFLNRGTFNSLMLHGQLNSLRNYGTIDGTEIDLIIRGAIYNPGLILGLDRTSLISLTSQIENTGRIVGTNSYKVIAQGQIRNAGDITGENGIVSSTEGRLENGGRISGAKIQSKSFRNGYKGVVINSSVTTEDGENLGDLDLQALTVNQGTFANKGRLTANSLLGSGTFKNHTNLSLRGTATNRAVLGIRSFHNQTTLDDAAIFEGGFVTILDSVRRFILEQGQTNIADLMFETSAPASIYRNAGILSIGFMALNQQIFENSGSMTITHCLGGTGTVSNKKKLIIQGRSSFAQGSLVNTDVLALANGGVFGTIDNHSTLEIDPGSYTISTLRNHNTTALFGDSWTISDRATEQAGNHVHIQTLENAGTVGGEHRVVYDRAEPRAGLWEAETFVYRQTGKTLTPQDLINLVADHVEVEAANFAVPEVSTISLPHLILRLTDNFNIDKDLTTQALEAYVQGDFRCGINNDNMVRLTTYGPLTVHSGGLADARYAKIFATGPVNITGLLEVKSGSTKASKQSFRVFPVKSWGGASTQDYRLPPNGAYIVSQSDITLTSPKRIAIQTAEIYSTAGEITFNAPMTLNSSGKIKSPRNITFTGAYLGGPSNCMTWNTGGRDIFRLVFGDPSLLQAGGNIIFGGSQVKNYGGQILAGDSIYYQDRVVASKDKPFDGSFENVAGDEFYTAGNGQRIVMRPFPALVQAGQTVSINAGDILLTGTTSAFTISMQSNTFAARNVGRRTQRPQYDTHVFVDLAEFAHSVYGPDGFIRTAPDGRIVTDIPVPGGFTPTIPQRLFIDSQASSSNMASTSSGIPAFLTDPTLQFAIDSMPLPFILQQALAQYAGTLNIDGRSGDPLMQYLLDNAQELKEQHGTALISRQDLKKARKSLLAYNIDPTSPTPLARPLLVLPQEVLNLLQDSGDISAQSTVNIHATKSQEHSGNRVRGIKGVSTTSDGTFRAQTTKETIASSSGNRTVTAERVASTQEFLSPEGRILLQGDEELATTGINLAARDGLNFTSANGDIIDTPLSLTTRLSETTSKKKRHGLGHKKTTTTTHTQKHTIVPTTKATQGNTLYHLGNDARTTRLTATQNYSGGDIVFDGGTAEITAHLVYDRSETRTTTKKTFSSDRKHEQIQTPVITPAALVAAGKVHFTNRTKKGTITGSTIQAPVLLNETPEGLAAEPTVGVFIYRSQQKQGNRFVNVQIFQDTGQEVMAPTILNVGEIITENSPLRLTSVNLLENTVIRGTYEEATRHLNSWNNVRVKAKQVPAGVIAIVALATAIATGGAGAALIGVTQGLQATLASAAFSSLCSQVATTFVATGGDLSKTMQSVVSRQALVSLASSLVTAGTLHSLNITAPTGYADLGDIAKYSAQKVLVESSANVAFGQQSLREALQGAGLNFITSVAGRYAAQQIGQAYGGFNEDGSVNPDGPSLNFFEHKILHGLVGAGLGAIQGDIAAGALGGMVSELIADLTKEDVDEIAAKVKDKASAQGIAEGSPEFNDLINNEIRSTIDWSKLGAATATFLMGHDANVGIETATNALEHNFLPMIFLAVEAASLAMSAYDAYTAYEEDGAEGLAESLATDAVMGVTTAGVGKLVLKGGKAAANGVKKAVHKVKSNKASKSRPSCNTEPVASSSSEDIASSATSAAKPKRNILRPDPNAEGAHTTFKVDESGNVRNYETYTSNPRNPTGFDTVKRVDMQGEAHFNKSTQEYVPTPHVQAKNIPGGVRPALPEEIVSTFKTD